MKKRYGEEEEEEKESQERYGFVWIAMDLYGLLWFVWITMD